MRCDLCNAKLPEGYVPEVDAHDRPVQLLCLMCSDVQTIERARRLGLPAPDLLDLFVLHMRRVLPMRVH